MSRIKTPNLVILISCFGLAATVNAGSFYSSKGIGLVHPFVSGRAVGMGGTGLGLTDNYSANYLNPATLAAIQLASISGTFVHEATDLKGQTQNAFVSDTNVNGFQFIIPLKRNRAAMAIGVNPYSSIEFSFSRQDSLAGTAVQEVVTGDGGVNTAFLSLSVKPRQNVYLGISGLFYFGQLRNLWRVSFVSAQFLDTQSEVSQSVTAASIRLGFVYRILPQWSLGGVFSPSVNLNAKKIVSLAAVAEFSDFPDSDLKLPSVIAVGTSFQLARNWVLAADYHTQKWSSVESGGYVNDSKRISVGVEYFPNGSLRSSYLSRMAYRAGLFYRDLGLEEPAGEKVTELFATVGFGLPIKWSAARIDLALEAGRRGSVSTNPFKETVIRLTGTITVGERWFYRGGPR